MASIIRQTSPGCKGAFDVTTQLNLVPTYGMRGVLPPCHLYVWMAQWSSTRGTSEYPEVFGCTFVNLAVSSCRPLV